MELPGRAAPLTAGRWTTGGWYRGDCHVHSVHSDGELTPVELRLELAGVADPQVRVHTERGKAPWEAGGRVSAAETRFVRVEVRHPDGRTAALTNPILLS
ncbi:hypothetical protein [Kitasatospora griseola]|uniref:hypothetical protein n=1 Tax=Kitasatospora griseola TaxID=2064 RepID=UPI000A8C7261|nr:hypothetical protein [Kitasatospora griseola]